MNFSYWYVWICLLQCCGLGICNRCIDYHEYLTDLREDGTVYSIYSFARKVGQALAGGLGGFAIAAVGYNSALKVQSQETLDGIYSLGTLVPGIIYLI